MCDATITLEILNNSGYELVPSSFDDTNTSYGVFKFDPSTKALTILGSVPMYFTGSEPWNTSGHVGYYENTFNFKIYRDGVEFGDFQVDYSNPYQCATPVAWNG